MEPQRVTRHPGTNVDDILVIHFTGEKVSLDAANAKDVGDQLMAIAEEETEPDVIVDFGNVEFASNTALGMLVDLHKKLAARGRRLQIHGVVPRVYEVFAVTGLDRFLRLVRLRPGVASPWNVCPTGVLVADEEEAVRSMLQVTLAAGGFSVWCAVHGQHAIDLYRCHRHTIALVLLDVLMPGLDGPHTLRGLQQLCPAVRCCFMTGNRRPYTEAALLQIGAVRVFRKPFAGDAIMDTLVQVTDPGRRCATERWLELAPVARRRPLATHTPETLR